MVAGRKGQGNDPLPGPEQAFGVGATFNKLSGKLMTRNDGGQYVPWGARESILRLNSTLPIVQIAAADAGENRRDQQLPRAMCGVGHGLNGNRPALHDCGAHSCLSLCL